MHQEWTDKLSEYLDDELPREERDAVDAHLRACADCSAVLNDLKRVVAMAKSAHDSPRPVETDLWPGIAATAAGAGRILTRHVSAWQPRRVTVSVAQLAAAAVVVAAVSGGLVARLMAPQVTPKDLTAFVAAPPAPPPAPADISAQNAPRLETVSLADDQYDAAVADLEKAVKQGRGKLDASTIAIVEHNLQIIDQAIAQAREALVADPANSYLSSHLVDARRRKLDLLRRAAALATDTN